MVNIKKTKNNFYAKIVGIVVLGAVFIVATFLMTYSYFQGRLEGATPINMIIETAILQLSFSDNNSYINAENILPGDSFTKTVVVNNSESTIPVMFNFVWLELNNEFSWDEMVMSATCATESGPCDSIDESIIPNSGINLMIKEDLEIPERKIYTYTFTIRFKEIDDNQDHNQGKSLNGRIGISSTI